MPANTNPIYTLTPNIGRNQITTTYAVVKSNGTTAGTSNDKMVKVFTTGSNGSYIDKIRFNTIASAAATTGVATTLRVFLSTVSAPESNATTGNTDTWLLGEVSVPAISSSHSTNATNYYDVVLNMAIPTGFYIHVAQHVAQTTNQQWQAIAIGGDY
ncbi:hypothetical protein [Polynucleobacter sp.]|uniref:hypothetical protein n=1 Tax=Polynucleobacter sp. TaxID=2029855 RepID=UPI003F69A3E0